MKKILLTSLFAIAAVASFAQGTIAIGNGITATRFPIYGPQVSDPTVSVVGNGPLSAPTGSTAFTGGLLSGTRYVIEFWAGPASAADFGGLSLVTSTTFRTGTGLLPNGITTTISGSIPGVLAGSQAKLAVRVWDTQSVVGGTGFAFATVRGQGALFTSGPLGGTAPDNSVFLPPNWVGQSFSLTAIPEPSSMALAGLGAASLLIFRRRK